MRTFEERRAACLARGFDLEPHTCCPRCHLDLPGVHAPNPDTARKCPCGWKGRHDELVDTVAAGRTVLPPEKGEEEMRDSDAPERPACEPLKEMRDTHDAMDQA